MENNLKISTKKSKEKRKKEKKREKRNKHIWFTVAKNSAWFYGDSDCMEKCSIIPRRFSMSWWKEDQSKQALKYRFWWYDET